MSDFKKDELKELTDANYILDDVQSFLTAAFGQIDIWLTAYQDKKKSKEWQNNNLREQMSLLRSKIDCCQRIVAVNATDIETFWYKKFGRRIDDV